MARQNHDDDDRSTRTVAAAGGDADRRAAGDDGDRSKARADPRVPSAVGGVERFALVASLASREQISIETAAAAKGATMKWHRISSGDYVASTFYQWPPLQDVTAIWSAELLGPAGWQLSICAPIASGLQKVTLAILPTRTACYDAADRAARILGHADQRGK